MSAIELSLGGRGPRRAFVFDPHRLALPAWHALGEGQPVLVISLDRHLDTVPPRAPPAHDLDGPSLAAYTRDALDPRNLDHLLAGMEAGVVSHLVAVARTVLPGAQLGPSWTDSQGRAHDLVTATTIDTLATGWGTPRAGPAARRAHALVHASPRLVLDLDLDCFTTPSDADPTQPIPWPRAVIRDFLLPRGSEAFWADVLADHRCVGLTLAREPGHCGGLVAAGRLFEDLAQVLFVELLHADLP
jgi:hypothetical protein